MKLLNRANSKFPHQINRKIYYEHTDAAGVVYYARYLYFLEQARSEALKEFGFTHETLLREYGLIFVVKKIEVDYLKPARLEDSIIIQSKLHDMRAASLWFDQQIINSKTDEICLKAQIKIASLNHEFRPLKIPKVLKISLSKLN